ncbi:N-acetylmuramoyl-L-alanine amidase Rv3717 [Frankia sp. AiPs1]|uniref:N-acetylmuramoyl-L-alanine amidase n=1 Tax=Frankia sp. AiPa1 TaxID=573492 RepID=UPI00202B6028|nr:N-acetylmuramoyl-L-alanine amidase [Frankia sp. AiPa1]MCL9758020.1 N-acetylmuramoyl-L-alanine amidase [Frankia sp. AiPa1]
MPVGYSNGRSFRFWAVGAVVVVLLALAAGYGLRVLLDRGGGGAVSTAALDPAAAQSLGGRVIVLDAGHNGGNSGDPAAINRQVPAGGISKECDTVGAQTDAGYPEHAFTFDVTQRAAAILRSRGATVRLTRTSDTGVGPCVDERAKIGNDLRADAVVSIHADGGPATGRGFHVIAPALSPDRTNEAILAPSAELATTLRAAFGRATGQPLADYLGQQGMTIRSDLGGLNLSRVPKVFLECGNMRNPIDAAELVDPAWRARAANGLADGVSTFLSARPTTRR